MVPSDAAGRLTLTSGDSLAVIEYTCDRWGMRGQDVIVSLESRVGFGQRGFAAENFNFDVQFGDYRPDDWNLIVYDRRSVAIQSSVASIVGGRSLQQSTDAMNGVSQSAYGEIKNPEGWTRKLVDSGGKKLRLRYALPGGHWTYPVFDLPEDSREKIRGVYDRCSKKAPI